MELENIDIMVVCMDKSINMEHFDVHPSYVGKDILEIILGEERAFQRKRLLVSDGVYC